MGSKIPQSPRGLEKKIDLIHALAPLYRKNLEFFNKITCLECQH
jgi:hypothetical protein